MNSIKNKIAAIIMSVLMITVIGGAVAMAAHAQTAGSIDVPTIAFCNVAPNPCGVGQTVTVDFWLAVPLFDSERAVGMTIYVTPPGGTQTSLGTFTTDTTGGTFTTYTPTTVGNYTFQLKYAGQQYTGADSQYYNEPSISEPATLIVTSTPRGGLADTPLPTNYWEAPVNSENVQLWSSISGPWMGYVANTFAATGGYNETGNYNPYTVAPSSSHILWTKPWCVGGVAGGPYGNNEQSSSYWTTSQYDPKYAPIIMDGIEYSTWYTTQTGSSQGIMAFNLYTGQTMWIINTTLTLRCGMILNFPTIDQYGCVGPYIIAQNGGGLFSSPNAWTIYDGLTGQQVATVKNVPAWTAFGADSNGNLIGYIAATNSSAFGPTYPTLTVQQPTINALGQVQYKAETFNTVTHGPVLEMYNFTQAIVYSGTMSALGGLFDWTLPAGTVFDFNTGLQWAVSENAVLNGVVVQGLGTSGLVATTYWFGNTLVMQQGTTSVEEQQGWLVEAGFSTANGQLMWITNRTGGVFNPAYTRISNTPAGCDGVYCEINYDSYEIAGYSLVTGTQLWTTNLNVRMSDGFMPNQYDSYGLTTTPDTTTGVLYIWGLGGDVWAVNMTNGVIMWSWSTYQINGPAGTESPYGTYPLWVFSDEALAGQGADTILYLSEGHEYNPPLLHGALEVALNGNTGQLVWSNLGFDDTATAVAYGVMTTFNSYDGQIYAYAQGPSKITINAPSIGATTKTPVTITGTITDVSPGASQSAVAKNFPNGLPCVSDPSMSGLMEAAYEQQPLPSNTTGVPISIYVLDSNNNYRSIGQTTSNALGDWGLTWTPDITGNYTVYAVFAGSHGYYPSSASTFLYAGAPPASTAPTTTPATNLASNSTVEYGIVAIAIIIIVIGAVLALLVTRKHP